jgi:hypothetical protein
MGTTLPRNRALIQEEYLANQNRSVMHGVTRQVFTLRADMARLRRFVDSYLNFVDDDLSPPFYFQPAVPFVILELLHYPYLTVASRNLISYPQREMSFTIPLECYAAENGALVFKQFAICVPFLYVDEQLSVVAGRELFGLPKVAIRFENLIDDLRPNVPAQIARLTLRTPGRHGDAYSPFIEVYREPSRYVSFLETPRNLISALPEALQGYYTLVLEAWEAFARPPMRGYDNRRDLQSMLEMLRANAEALSAGLPFFPLMRRAPEFAESSADEQLGPSFIDIIGLKQARDAEHREFVSFQSLVRSAMYIDRINDAGFLFGPLASNPSNDVTIRIHHQLGQPLVESLGLVTEETISADGIGGSRGPGGQGDDASDPVPQVSTLRPLLPYWMNVDLTYGLGINLYWRGKNTEWSDTNNPGRPNGLNRYITIGSGASQESASRIVAPHSQIWVLQLPLDEQNGGPQRLNQLCVENLENDCYAFRLAPGPEGQPPSVWMFIRNMDNTGEGRGPDVEQEVAFAVTIDWFHSKNGDPWGPPIGQLLMPLFVLTDNQTAVFTESEVFGRPTVRADITFQGANWTSTSEFPVASMNVSTLIIPELYSGDSAERRRIVAVDVKPSRTLKALPAQSPEVLSLPTVNLKQIVNCHLPSRVDFQAIVSQVLAVKPYKYEQPTVADPALWSVRIYRYGSLPLVQNMGLKVAERESGKYTTIEVVRPSGVWSVAATVEELGAVNLAWRLGNSPWISHKDPLAMLKKIAPDIRNITGVLSVLSRLLSIYQRLFKKREPNSWIDGLSRLSAIRPQSSRKDEPNDLTKRERVPRGDRRNSPRPRR